MDDIPIHITYSPQAGLGFELEGRKLEVCGAVWRSGGGDQSRSRAEPIRISIPNSSTLQSWIKSGRKICLFSLFQTFLLPIEKFQIRIFFN